MPLGRAMNKTARRSLRDDKTQESTLLFIYAAAGVPAFMDVGAFTLLMLLPSAPAARPPVVNDYKSSGARGHLPRPGPQASRAKVRSGRWRRRERAREREEGGEKN